MDKDRKPDANDLASWLLLRTLEWHRLDIGKTANAGGLEGVNRKVRFPATIDGVQFWVTVEKVEKKETSMDDSPTKDGKHE